MPPLSSAPKTAQRESPPYTTNTASNTLFWSSIPRFNLRASRPLLSLLSAQSQNLHSSLGPAPTTLQPGSFPICEMGMTLCPPFPPWAASQDGLGCGRMARGSCQVGRPASLHPRILRAETLKRWGEAFKGGQIKCGIWGSVLSATRKL